MDDKEGILLGSQRKYVPQNWNPNKICSDIVEWANTNPKKNSYNSKTYRGLQTTDKEWKVVISAKVTLGG